METVPPGLEISFLLFGLPVVHRVAPGSNTCASAGSWSPGGPTTTCTTGNNMQGLLSIDYGFHFTLMIAAIALAYCFLSLTRQRSDVVVPAARVS